MTVGSAKRIAYTAVRVMAAGLAVYLLLWASVTILELAVLMQWGRRSEAPLPPPGDPWLRVPTLALVLVGGLWSARRAWREQPRVLPVWSLGFLLAVSGGGFVIDQVREAEYLQCSSVDATEPIKQQRRDCGRWEALQQSPDGDSDTLVSAGDQACSWLEDRPWGEPPDAGGIAAETLASYYAQDLEASGGVLTSEEALSARVALPAWYGLCPFQQNVHHGGGFGD
jgi:hypothetical protein